MSNRLINTTVIGCALIALGVFGSITPSQAHAAIEDADVLFTCLTSAPFGGLVGFLDGVRTGRSLTKTIDERLDAIDREIDQVWTVDPNGGKIPFGNLSESTQNQINKLQLEYELLNDQARSIVRPHDLASAKVGFTVGALGCPAAFIAQKASISWDAYRAQDWTMESEAKFMLEQNEWRHSESLRLLRPAQVALDHAEKPLRMLQDRRFAFLGAIAASKDAQAKFQKGWTLSEDHRSGLNSLIDSAQQKLTDARNQLVKVERHPLYRQLELRLKQIQEALEHENMQVNNNYHQREGVAIER